MLSLHYTTSVVRIVSLFLLVTNLSFVTTPEAIAQKKASEPEYGMVLFKKNLMIPMRDGVKLATDIYRPTLNGKLVEEKLPILLQRTPYGKFKAEQAPITAEYVKRGYIVVTQDCRGRYESEGIFTKYLAEPEDGYDTVEGLAKLPFTNGKIGMFGSSYGGHVQASAAKLNPPHLSTIVVQFGGTSNGWESGIRNYGPLDHKQLTWAFGQILAETTDLVVKAFMQEETKPEWFASLPLKKGLSPLAANPEIENYIFEMMKHENYDSYWKQMGYNWQEYYKQTSDIPTMLIGGWYDGYCKTTIDNYLGLSKIKKSPVHMIMGPWVHGGTARSHSGDAEFGEDAVISSEKANLGGGNWKSDWYDHFLKGKKNNIENMKPVHLFVMGTGDGHKDANGRLFHSGYWRHENGYPLANTRFERYYLQPNMTLNKTKPSEKRSATTYTFDPSNPVPTIGSATASSQPMWTGGAFNQREKEFTGNPETGFYGSKPPYLPLKARKDVIVFQTEKLTEDMEIVGPVTVTLHVSSTAPDTDFTVKLIDVYPPSKDYPAGYEMNITDGILRAKFRESSERQVLMKPGEVYQLTIKPFDTGNIFKKGHRIRLDISSSNFPHYEVNPNTGENPAFSSRSQIAENTIYHNAVRASYIDLPVVPSAKK